MEAFSKVQDVYCWLKIKKKCNKQFKNAYTSTLLHSIATQFEKISKDLKANSSAVSTEIEYFLDFSLLCVV